METNKTNKVSTQYATLCIAHSSAARAYHNALSTSRETETGLALNMAAKAVRSFEERHPEVVREGW